jgi:periplasmic protein TonB
MTENRFFRSLLTVTASSVLVGGSLILLTSTAPWTPAPQAESEPSTPDSSQFAAGPAVEFPRPAVEADQARTGFSDDVAVDRTATASTDDEPSPTEPEATGLSDTPSPEDGEAVAALGTPRDAGTEDEGAEDVGAEGMVVTDAAPEPDAALNTEAAPDAVSALQAAPEISLAEAKTAEASDQIGGLLAGLPPRVIASDASGAATEQVGELLAASPPAPAPIVAAAAPPPPLPARKPEGAPEAAQDVVAALPKAQDKPALEAPKPAPRQEVARQEPTQPQSKGPWRPMGLAPADKPVPAQVPTARPSGAAYASSVWSALARHKPRAGQNGSTTVVFAIGGNGALRGLKVGRSSGNARIDQLALATVRSAAPFAPPPSGSASYTIRIDFH